MKSSRSSCFKQQPDKELVPRIYQKYITNSIKMCMSRRYFKSDAWGTNMKSATSLAAERQKSQPQLCRGEDMETLLAGRTEDYSLCVSLNIHMCTIWTGHSTLRNESMRPHKGLHSKCLQHLLACVTVWDRVSPSRCSSRWWGTHSVYQAGLASTDPLPLPPQRWY